MNAPANPSFVIRLLMYELRVATGSDHGVVLLDRDGNWHETLHPFGSSPDSEPYVFRWKWPDPGEFDLGACSRKARQMVSELVGTSR